MEVFGKESFRILLASNGILNGPSGKYNLSSILIMLLDYYCLGGTKRRNSGGGCAPTPPLWWGAAPPTPPLMVGAAPPHPLKVGLWASLLASNGL